MSPIRNIGILGAGQLARMTALAGLPLGFRFAVYDTSGRPSAGIGDIFTDPGNQQHELDAFLAAADIVTYEFEHLPLDLARNVAARRPLHPNVESLSVCQDREKEKNLFRELDIPTAEFAVCHSREELREHAQELGLPLVAKSATQGYDGKGQAVIRRTEEIDTAWDSIGHERLLVEKFVEFKRELSIIAARSTSGEIRCWPLVENMHHQGILRYTLAPAPQVSEEQNEAARGLIGKILERLDYIGVLALELFETEEGLMANEMAPRVHNSGHWSQDGAATSQFENHLRAICGLPLGPTEARGMTCMVNLIGCDIDLSRVAAHESCYIHLYDKEARPGRKLGHLNVCSDSYEKLHEQVRLLRADLPPMPDYPYT